VKPLNATQERRSGQFILCRGVLQLPRLRRVSGVRKNLQSHGGRVATGVDHGRRVAGRMGGYAPNARTISSIAARMRAVCAVPDA
jgi:hypothetical protein